MLPVQRAILGELLLEGPQARSSWELVLEGPQARSSCYNQVKDAQDQTVG